MTLPETIQAAQKSGYDINKSFEVIKKYSSIYLDPKFWIALGKSLGWGKEPDKDGICLHCGVATHIQPDFESGCNHPQYPDSCAICYKNTKTWEDQWHNFIDALADGQTPAEFFKQF